MSALDDVRGKGLTPCGNGAAFLRSHATFEEAWKKAPNGAWLAWYLEAVRTTLAQQQLDLAKEVVRACVALLDDTAVHSPLHAELAVRGAQRGDSFHSVLLWATMAFPSTGRAAFLAQCATVIRARFPSPPNFVGYKPRPGSPVTP